MGVSQPTSEWDLTRVKDDLLVVFAQKAGDQEAVQELLGRYYEWMRRYVARLARRVHLPKDDLPDAQQNGVLAIEKAIAAYNVACARPASFLSFLTKLVRARFYDEEKKARRRRRRQGGWAGGGPADVAEVVDDEADRYPWLAGEAHDPAVAAEQHEWREHFQRVLGQLEPHLRRVWEGLAAGERVEATAVALGVPAWKVRRWRAKVHAILAGALGE